MLTWMLHSSCVPGKHFLTYHKLKDQWTEMSTKTTGSYNTMYLLAIPVSLTLFLLLMQHMLIRHHRRFSWGMRRVNYWSLVLLGPYQGAGLWKFAKRSRTICSTHVATTSQFWKYSHQEVLQQIDPQYHGLAQHEYMCRTKIWFPSCLCSILFCVWDMDTINYYNLKREIDTFGNKCPCRIMGYCCYGCVSNQQLIHKTELRPWPWTPCLANRHVAYYQ